MTLSCQSRAAAAETNLAKVEGVVEQASSTIKDLLDRAGIGFGADFPSNDILKPPEQSGAKRILILGQVE